MMTRSSRSTLNSLMVTNATVVLTDQVLEGATVRVDDGIIIAVDPGPVNATTEQAQVVDADGAYLIPGVVDLHNDNLEFEIHPRANANLPLPFALSSMERRLASSGVTTEFHAISFQDRPNKKRSITDAEAKAAFIARFDDDPRHGVRHHILHRLDVRSPDSLEAALPSLRRVRVPYVSLKTIRRVRGNIAMSRPSSSGVATTRSRSGTMSGSDTPR